MRDEIAQVCQLSSATSTAILKDEGIEDWPNRLLPQQASVPVFKRCVDAKGDVSLMAQEWFEPESIFNIEDVCDAGIQFWLCVSFQLLVIINSFDLNKT